MIFNKHAKAIKYKKENLFNRWCQNNSKSHLSALILYTTEKKVTHNYIHAKPKTIKLLEKHIGKYHGELGREFLHKAQRAYITKEQN